MIREMREIFSFGKEDIPKAIEEYRNDPDKELIFYEETPGSLEILTLSKGKHCAAVGSISAKKWYQVLQEFHCWLFQDPNDFIESKSWFLLCLSQAIYQIPALVKMFEAVYEENPIRYYKKAVSDELYKHPALSESNLMRDFSTRRIYGLLLTAEEDIELRKQLENLFYTYDVELKDLIDREAAILSERSNHQLYNKNGEAAWYIFAYLLLNRYDGGAAPFITYFVRNAVELDKENAARKREDDARKYIKDERDPFRFLECSSPYAWRIIRNTKSINDLQSVALADEEDAFVKEWADQSLNLELKRLVESCPTEEPCYGELERTKHLLKYFAVDANMRGQSVYQMLYGRSISKVEQQELLREYVWHHYATCKKSEKFTKIKLTVDSYVTMLLYHFLIQNAVDEKKFFFENNNETMFSKSYVLTEQFERLQHEREQVDEKIKELTEEISSLRGENKRLKVALKKENKMAEAPYHEERTALYSQIDSLEKKLSEEEEKTIELNRLREFAFDVQSQYAPHGTETDFADRIKGKRIIVVGGHVNWRNRLKKKHPEITVLDGHVETYDSTLFDKADFVFLNVSNMNHGVYYKAIGALRGSKTPFDYLGRTINQELYEREMADILSKHGID